LLNLLIKVSSKDTTDGLLVFKLVTPPKKEKILPSLFLDPEIKPSSSGNSITIMLTDFMDNLKDK
jgi:hypothetical protein